MTDEEYEAAIDELLEETVESLKSARGKPAEIKATIAEYLERGDALEMSPMELRDYFDISDPGLHEQAGFSEEECEQASEVFTEVSDARYPDS